VRLKSTLDVSKTAAYSFSSYQGANRLAANVALEQDPKAVLQTGPGVPSWTWRRYSLAWSGPVGRDHTIRLVLPSPGVNRVLTALPLSLLPPLAFLLLPRPP